MAPEHHPDPPPAPEGAGDEPQRPRPEPPPPGLPTGAAAPDSNPNATLDLLRAYRRDPDPLLIERLIERYQGRIQRIVRVRLGSGLRTSLESMDVVQDVNLTLLRKLPDFEEREGGRLIDWLARIVQRQIHDRARYFGAEKRRSDRTEPLDRGDPKSPPEPEPAGASRDDPARHALEREDAELLDDAVGALPDDQRDVVLLRDYCNTPWEGIAEDLSRSVGAAQQLYARACIELRRTLRKSMDDRAPEPPPRRGPGPGTEGRQGAEDPDTGA